MSVLTQYLYMYAFFKKYLMIDFFLLFEFVFVGPHFILDQTFLLQG